MRHLHELRVLKLVTSGHRRNHSHQTYQENADKTFEILCPSCPQLTVIVLESVTYLNTSTWSFVRPTKVGQRGAQSRFLGMDLAPYVVKDYEPCSDMLEPEKWVFG
jgi:hypothetical protein